MRCLNPREEWARQPPGQRQDITSGEQSFPAASAFPSKAPLSFCMLHQPLSLASWVLRDLTPDHSPLFLPQPFHPKPLLQPNPKTGRNPKEAGDHLSTCTPAISLAWAAPSTHPSPQLLTETHLFFLSQPTLTPLGSGGILGTLLPIFKLFYNFFCFTCLLH